MKAHELKPSAIRAAIPVGGAYDIAAYYDAHLEANGKEMAERHVLDVFGRREGALADASPTTHMKKTKVPMLVLSERDTLAYTKLFEQAAAKGGLAHIRFRHFPERSHRTIQSMMAREGPDDARDALVAFVASHAAAAR